MAQLQDVFKVSGIPTHTFVEPTNFTELRVSVRTRGRCAVIEGPSGIGKTTSVLRVLKEISDKETLILSARRTEDLELIAELPSMKSIGTVVIDDFHRLPDTMKSAIADFMKLLADSEDEHSKLIIIGINKAGDHIVKFGKDIGLRIDVFKFETNPEFKVDELISKGEQALNITIQSKDSIVSQSHGSFQIAQMLCLQTCMACDILETQDTPSVLSISSDVIIERAMSALEPIFKVPAREFARGVKLKREGRAPYLHILRWLAEGAEWSLDLREATKSRPELRGSVIQVLEKGFLERLLEEKHDVLDGLFDYQPSTAVISVEDPRFVFYLRNLVWKNFVRETGYTTEYFPGRYDIALSFAGEDRKIAQMFFDKLTEREVSVFYDENEQHRILANNIEEYLGPIYRSEASYVVPLLSSKYPRKIWTKFESDQFKGRFGDGAVIPIRFADAPEGFFSDTAEYGGLWFDPQNELEAQIDKAVAVIANRLIEDRQSATGPTPQDRDAGPLFAEA